MTLLKPDLLAFADELEALHMATSPAPWRWQNGEGLLFVPDIVFSADGGSAVAKLENRLGREQTDSDAAAIVIARNLLPFAALALRALDNLLEIIDTFHSRDEYGDNTFQDIEDARDALAAATAVAEAMRKEE